MDIRCIEEHTAVPRSLFRTSEVSGTQIALKPCGVQVRAVDATAAAPSRSDMGLMRLSEPTDMTPIPVGSMRSSTVTVIGYGMTESSANILQRMNTFSTRPLSDATCASITSRISVSDRWVCLAHGNASICHGDSGGGMIADGVLVAVNSQSSFSTTAGDCRINAVSMHLKVDQFATFISSVAASWGDRVTILRTPAPPTPPAPLKSTQFNTIGGVYVRGLRGGSNQTLWCAGAALTPDAVIVSAMCIGRFDQFEVYDAYTCAVDTKLCQGRSRRAALAEKHPSMATYEAQFFTGNTPTIAGVDLAVLAVCGAPLNSVAVVDPPSVLTAVDESGIPSKVRSFSRSECEALMAVYNRPYVVCAAYVPLITGTPLFGNMGVAAITSLMFYGRGIRGQNTETEVFTVGTAIAPFAKWIANAIRGFTAYGGTVTNIRIPKNPVRPTCPTIDVPPSSETSSTSSDVLGAFEPLRPPAPVTRRPPPPSKRPQRPPPPVKLSAAPLKPPPPRRSPPPPPPPRRSPPSVLG